MRFHKGVLKTFYSTRQEPNGQQRKRKCVSMQRNYSVGNLGRDGVKS